MVSQLSSDDGRSFEAKEELARVLSAVECLHVMLYQESVTYPTCANYLANIDVDRNNMITTGGAVINGNLRQKICEWAFDVVDHFGYQREAAVLSTCYLDRFASISYLKGAHLGTRSFQLAAVASFLIATKVEGKQELQSTINKEKEKITISTLVLLSRGRYSVQEIQQMEREILNALQWKLSPPTTVQFISHIVQLFPVLENCHSSPSHDVYLIIFEMAKYLAELSVCVPELAIGHKPSTIALACFLVAIDSTDTRSIHHDFSQAFKASVANILKIDVDSKEVDEILEILKVISLNEIPEQGLNSTTQDSQQLLQHHRYGQSFDDSTDGHDSPICVSEDLSHYKG